MVDADGIVSVTGEKIRSISRPRERRAERHLGVFAHRSEVNSELVNHALGLKVPDLDGTGGGGYKPIPVGWEYKGVDDVTSLKGVESLSLSKVPKHGNSVFAAWGTKRAIGGDSDTVEVSGVADKVGSQFAGAQWPDLHDFVPAGWHDNGGGDVGRESDARHPLGVAILGDGVFAVTDGVPDLDSQVTRAWDDLSVVRRESNGEHVLGVSNESARAVAGLDLPQTEGGIPWAGQGEVSIRGDHDVRNEVVVASEGTLGEAVVAVLTGKSPADDGL